MLDREIAFVLWRRLDTPGHDACRLALLADGWALEGAAVFKHGDAPAHLTYRIETDADWRTRHGRVTGWVGARGLDVIVTRTHDVGWMMNDVVMPEPGGCLDLDLGFTPATNLLQIRRLALGKGESADAPAAWFNIDRDTLQLLPQRYERRSETTYWYEAPTEKYSGMLEVSADGFIRRYPELWEAVTDVLTTSGKRS